MLMIGLERDVRGHPVSCASVVVVVKDGVSECQGNLRGFSPQGSDAVQHSSSATGGSPQRHGLMLVVCFPALLIQRLHVIQAV